jgi:hypothetical protein
MAEGWRAIGIDIERHDYGSGGYPGELILQDMLTIHGSQMKDADCLVFSPPCQRYSYMAMPWKRAKAQAAEILDDTSGEKLRELNALFDACFRIQREASEAAGHHIPMVVENVVGAQKWVGRAKWHYGSFYLWGDVPAVMPSARHLKVPGMNFHDFEKTGKPGRSFQSAAVKKGLAREWRNSPNGMPMMSSKSPARKAASALIAKIPFELARWVAHVYKPEECAA